MIAIFLLLSVLFQLGATNLSILANTTFPVQREGSVKAELLFCESPTNNQRLVSLLPDEDNFLLFISEPKKLNLLGNMTLPLASVAISVAINCEKGLLYISQTVDLTTYLVEVDFINLKVLQKKALSDLKGCNNDSVQILLADFDGGHLFLKCSPEFSPDTLNEAADYFTVIVTVDVQTLGIVSNNPLQFPNGTFIDAGSSAVWANKKSSSLAYIAIRPFLAAPTIPGLIALVNTTTWKIIRYDTIGLAVLSKVCPIFSSNSDEVSALAFANYREQYIVAAVKYDVKLFQPKGMFSLPLGLQFYFDIASDQKFVYYLNKFYLPKLNIGILHRVPIQQWFSVDYFDASNLDADEPEAIQVSNGIVFTLFSGDEAPYTLYKLT